MIDEQDRRRLLGLVGESIRAHLQQRELPRIDDPSPALTARQGVFVTLRLEGHLRGCVGLVERSTPLWEGVREMAVAAAVRDSRFEPVQLQELDSIRFEISVLSEMEPIQGPDQIEIGRHGIYLRKGSRTGLLLPQVATERRWGPVQFLDRTCQKASLPPEAWKEGAEIFVFSCEVFDDTSTDLGET